MKALIATALLLCSDGSRMEEDSSLMQGLLARHGQLAVSETHNATKNAREDATTKLMETATNMMKNGVTPDVVQFIESTINEVNRNVLGAIKREHDADVASVAEKIDEFSADNAEMDSCITNVETVHTLRVELSLQHKECRAGEALACARSRQCEVELEQKWTDVVAQEAAIKEIYTNIHKEWCPIGEVGPHPDLTNTWDWTLNTHYEGPETRMSDVEYPTLTYSEAIKGFRRDSAGWFADYKAKKKLVEDAWKAYNLKLLDCAKKEEELDATVDKCDEDQEKLHQQACLHATKTGECTEKYGNGYASTRSAWDSLVERVESDVADRKKEWETLHIITCLLETVYTRVIHSIDSGEPCPTEESAPEQTASEIENCHNVPADLTANLTIMCPRDEDKSLRDCPPAEPNLPKLLAPPCTSEYLWDEHGEFPQDIRETYISRIQAEDLEGQSTGLSPSGWAGCAAPKACEVCPGHTDEEPVSNNDPAGKCEGPGGFLRPGQMALGYFKCANGDGCIPATARCNGDFNCGDNSDETGCPNDGVMAPTGEAAPLFTLEECSGNSDVEWTCSNGRCIPIEGRCDGVAISSCDGSDEQNCKTGADTGVTLEPTSGYKATLETARISEKVFYDRDYTFESLGSFTTGYQFVKIHNDDKTTPASHTVMKLRLPQPTTVFVLKLEDHDLPWLTEGKWEETAMEGVKYSGTRQTRHTEWDDKLLDQTPTYGPGKVWKRTFPAGVVEMRGNNGVRFGSYLTFLQIPQ